MKTEILGVGFDALTLQQAVDAGAELLRENTFHYVVTPNPEFLLAAERDREFHELLNAADLVLPDGIGVVYAAKILGRALPGRVPGVDFASGLLQRLSDEKAGTRLFLLGAKPGVAQQAGKRLAARYPGITLCGTQDGYFSDETAVVAAIAKAQAEVVFVCLGAPKQEKWMARWGALTSCRLAVGLGGALDVFSGHVKRAPEIWQRLGLEWAYRLVREPSRAGRMARLPLVLGKALVRRLAERKGAGR